MILFFKKRIALFYWCIPYKKSREYILINDVTNDNLFELTASDMDEVNLDINVLNKCKEKDNFGMLLNIFLFLL